MITNESLNNIHNQTIDLMNDIYWKYFRLNKTINNMTKEERYTLGSIMEHIKHNLDCLKNAGWNDERSKLIKEFNDQYNKYGIGIKESE